MVQQTTDYKMFSLRPDNREKINDNHLKKIINSITIKNLLELRPILINDDMEVIDGQHRLLAAENLQVPIYYEVKKNLQNTDIVLMNIRKNWMLNDYLNFYCKNGYIEYQKLKSFCTKNGITTRIALNLVMGRTKKMHDEFKLGNFKFSEGENHQENIEVVWETIGLIKKLSGFSGYTSSTRFWQALTRLISQPMFIKEKWIANTGVLIERFGPRANIGDYYKMMVDVYNFRNQHRIDLESD